jgi:hypothetical protein
LATLIVIRVAKELLVQLGQQEVKDSKVQLVQMVKAVSKDLLVQLV